MWLPWKGQPTILASRMIVSPDCQPILPMITPKYLTVEASPTEKHRRILPRHMAALPLKSPAVGLSQMWWHEDSNHMAASLPNWHNRRNTANGFTLASLYYSIVNPCHSKLVACILFKSEAFVFYSELTKLQNLECTAAYWRLPQRPLKFWSSLLVTGLVLSDPTNPIIYMGTKDAVQDLGIGWSSKQK